jgi:hypothetical protein
MRCMASRRLIVVMLTVLSHATSVVAEVPWSVATVVGLQVQGTGSLRPNELEAMIAEADALWRPYGVTTVWLTPPERGPWSAVDVVLTIHFVRGAESGGAGDRRLLQLGTIAFYTGRPEQTLNLLPDQIAAIIADAPWVGRRLRDWPPSVRDGLRGRALGRVLAHELGHYLLAARTHTETGLMRGSMSAEALVSPDRRPFQLDASDQARVRARYGGAPRDPLAFLPRSVLRSDDSDAR